MRYMEKNSYDRRALFAAAPPFSKHEQDELFKIIRKWVSPETTDEWVEKLKKAYMECDFALDREINKVLKKELDAHLQDYAKTKMLHALFGFSV